jgi:Cytochrome P460
MIEAYKAGIPGNGKPVPDGARRAKIHWVAKKDEAQPGEPIVPGVLHDVSFMVKDSKRFADSGGWGWAQFDYDPATETFRPADTSSTPPQVEFPSRKGRSSMLRLGRTEIRRQQTRCW